MSPSTEQLAEIKEQRGQVALTRRMVSQGLEE